MNWAKNVLIGLDQFANTLRGGWPDETLSAEAWRRGKNSKPWGRLRIVIDRIFWFDPQHCFKSYISEFERTQLPDEYRGDNAAC